MKKDAFSLEVSNSLRDLLLQRAKAMGRSRNEMLTRLLGEVDPAWKNHTQVLPIHHVQPLRDACLKAGELPLAVAAELTLRNRDARAALKVNDLGQAIREVDLGTTKLARQGLGEILFAQLIAQGYTPRELTDLRGSIFARKGLETTGEVDQAIATYLLRKAKHPVGGMAVVTDTKDRLLPSPTYDHWFEGWQDIGKSTPFLTSPSVNVRLRQGALDGVSFEWTDFSLDPAFNERRALAVSRQVRDGKDAFNGPMVGWLQNLSAGLPESVLLVETSYFDYLASNDAYARAMQTEAGEWISGRTGEKRPQAPDESGFPWPIEPFIPGLPNSIGIAAAVVSADLRFLVLDHRGPGAPDGPALLGGSLVPADFRDQHSLGAALARGVCREIREETGLDTSQTRVLPLGLTLDVSRGMRPALIVLAALPQKSIELPLDQLDPYARSATWENILGVQPTDDPAIMEKCFHSWFARMHQRTTSLGANIRLLIEAAEDIMRWLRHP